jgi:hypothetical protein
MPIRVTGCGLLSLADDFCATNGYTRSQAVQAAGYYSFRPDGSTRLHFTDFYQEITDTRKALGFPSYQDEPDEEEEAPEPTEMEEAIANHFPEVDEDDIAEFARTMSDDFDFTPEQMRDSFRGKYANTEEFAKAHYRETTDEGIPSALEGHIDWAGVYDSEYESSHDIYEYGGDSYFFYIGG